MLILARKILPITTPAIDDGALLITGRKIVDVGRRKDILKKYPKEKVVDLSPALVMPGLVNAHTHLELSYLKGKLDEAHDFFDWITALVDYRRTHGAKGIREPMVSALRQAISSGTTCLGDISATDEALPLLIKIGARAVSFLEVIGLDPGHAQMTFDSLVKRLKKLDDVPDRIAPGISPHSAYSVSSQLFSKINDLASGKHLIVSVHLSETHDEMLYMQGKPSGMDGYMRKFGWDNFRPASNGTSMQYVKAHGLHGGLLAVHAAHVTKKDIKILSESGASVVQCPRSNHLLRVGKAPVELLLESGINVCIGTDSLASNIDLDLWEEMRFAYLVNRVNAQQVIRMATINGARALGLEDVIGSIEPGKDADLIAVESSAASSADPYRELLFGTRQGDVSLNMVQGKAIYSKNGYICDGL
jgi:cytosine/adenosine deaminase-related metal-dependent hydrolase